MLMTWRQQMAATPLNRFRKQFSYKLRRQKPLYGKRMIDRIRRRRRGQTRQFDSCPRMPERQSATCSDHSRSREQTPLLSNRSRRVSHYVAAVPTTSPSFPWKGPTNILGGVRRMVGTMTARFPELQGYWVRRRGQAVRRRDSHSKSD